jgi:hypothetical protein
MKALVHMIGTQFPKSNLSFQGKHLENARKDQEIKKERGEDLLPFISRR